jgi:lipoprotein-releasing system permease protein
MYKLFLCLRYLRSRVIAYFAILGVALCVAMMLIVISVMNGFLNKVESAAKGLFGHVTISAAGLGGVGHYEEFTRELKQKVGEVQAVTPFITTVGLLRVPGFDYRKDVQIVGIRLPGSGGRKDDATDYYHDVSDFKEGLFVQRSWMAPSFDPPRQDILDCLTKDRLLIESLAADNRGDRVFQVSARTAEDFHLEAAYTIRNAAFVEKRLEDLQKLREQLDKALEGPADRKKADELRTALGRQIEQLAEHYREFIILDAELRGLDLAGAEGDLDKLSGLLDRTVETLELKRFEPTDRRAIIGLGIPALIFRTSQGQTIRKIVPGSKIVLSLVPLGRKTVGSGSITPVSANFTVVDDCRTDVSSIDSNIIYLPFEALQKLNDMDSPDRCSQLLIRVRPPHAESRKLLAVCQKIRDVLEDFRARHPDMTETGDLPTVEPWAQRLSDIIDPLEKQRTLSAVMVGVISLVSVVLIFVIFYMIVVQKTRDIGVLKAIGGSSSGVAGIFLAYGAVIGLVGSIIGTIGGYYFVHYINEIQDAADRWFDFRVWRKEIFLFERIPNQVSSETAVGIIISAVVAGLIGAIIPAVRAARMQPVEALRYE